MSFLAGSKLVEHLTLFVQQDSLFDVVGRICSIIISSGRIFLDDNFYFWYLSLNFLHYNGIVFFLVLNYALQSLIQLVNTNLSSVFIFAFGILYMKLVIPIPWLLVSWFSI